MIKVKIIINTKLNKKTYKKLILTYFYLLEDNPNIKKKLTIIINKILKF
jgi:hypothetical protein